MPSNTSIGLIIEIEKRLRSSKRSGTNNSRHGNDASTEAVSNDMPQGLIIGHYDWMHFKPVSEWMDFAPDRAREASSGEGDNKGNSDNFLIRLCFPEEWKAKGMTAKIEFKNCGLNYEKWRTQTGEEEQAEDRKKKQEEHLRRLFEENPCVSVVLFSVTDEYKDGKNCNGEGGIVKNIFTDLLEDISCRLKKVAEEGGLGEQLAGSRCCVLPSLGYADYALLFAEKQWEMGIKVSELLQKLRDDNDAPIVSVDYAVSALFFKDKNITPPKSNLFPEDTSLASRLTLAPGWSSENVREQLNKCISEVVKEETTKEEAEAEKCYTLTEINDVGDCHITANDPVGSAGLLRMLMMSWNLFSGESEKEQQTTLKDLIQDSKSRLHWKKQMSSDSWRIPKRQETERKVDVLGGFNDAIRDYKKLCEGRGRTMRQVYALQETERILENIFAQPHSKVLRKELEPLLEAYTVCLQYLVEGLNQLQKEERGLTQQDLRKRRMEDQVRWGDIEDTLQRFYECVGGFAQDLSRSNNFVMENGQFHHSSVCSSTSLLLNFSKIINSIAEIRQEHTKAFIHDLDSRIEAENKGENDKIKERYENGNRHGFLLTSGGCDATTTLRMFPFLDPIGVAHEGGFDQFERFPFVMQVPEVGLYDCSSTMLRLVHELSHYCGRRFRKARSMLIIQYAANWLGYRIAEALLERPKDRFKKWCATRGYELDPNGSTKDLNEKIDGVYESQITSLAKSIRTEIAKILEGKAQCACKNDSDYIAQNFTQRLESAIYTLLICTDEDVDDRKCFIKYIRKVTSDNLRVFFEECHGCWEKFRCGTTCGSTGSGAGLEYSFPYQMMHIPVKELEEQIDYSLRTCIPYIERMLRDAHAIFSEAFSDIAACVILDATAEDYLLCFMGEGNSLDDVLPFSRVNFYRMRAVLNKLEKMGKTFDKESFKKVAVDLWRNKTERDEDKKDKIPREKRLLKRKTQICNVKRDLFNKGSGARVHKKERQYYDALARKYLNICVDGAGDDESKRNCLKGQEDAFAYYRKLFAELKWWEDGRSVYGMLAALSNPLQSDDSGGGGGPEVTKSTGDTATEDLVPIG